MLLLSTLVPLLCGVLAWRYSKFSKDDAFELVGYCFLAWAAGRFIV